MQQYTSKSINVQRLIIGRLVNKMNALLKLAKALLTNPDLTKSYQNAQSMQVGKLGREV